jgi:hypothetical protein
MSEPPNDSLMLTLNSTNADIAVSVDTSTLISAKNKQFDNFDDQVLKEESIDYFELDNLNILSDNVIEHDKYSQLEQQVEGVTSTSNDAIVEQLSSPLNSAISVIENEKSCEQIETQMSPGKEKIEIKKEEKERGDEEARCLFDDSIEQDLKIDNKNVELIKTNSSVSCSDKIPDKNNSQTQQQNQHQQNVCQSSSESPNNNTKKRKLNDDSFGEGLEDEDLNGKIKNKLYIKQLSIHVPNEIVKQNDVAINTLTPTTTAETYPIGTSCGEKTNNEWLQPSSTTPTYLFNNASDEYSQFPMLSSSSFIEFFTLVVSNRPAINDFIIESISENVFNFIRFTQVLFSHSCFFF